jgi:hypothetical protein
MRYTNRPGAYGKLRSVACCLVPFGTWQPAKAYRCITHTPNQSQTVEVHYFLYIIKEWTFSFIHHMFTLTDSFFCYYIATLFALFAWLSLKDSGCYRATSYIHQTVAALVLNIAPQWHVFGTFGWCDCSTKSKGRCFAFFPPTPLLYSPKLAMLLAWARASSTSRAASTFSSLPSQVFRQEVCSARPNEKVSAHGFGPGALLMQERATDASSSDMPPMTERESGK